MLSPLREGEEGGREEQEEGGEDGKSRGMRRRRRERRKEHRGRGRKRNRTLLKILGSPHLFIYVEIFSVRFPLPFHLQLAFTKKKF